jgi:nucleotide-binding universal stress UspA family protein
MNPGIVLLALVVIALVYVVGPVAAAAFWRWRRPWRLTCPRTGTVAQIRTAAVRASVAEVLGRRAEIERCSLWPALRGCRQECRALPVTSQRQMRRGEAPPRERASDDLRSILVPLDGSPGSETVLSAVGELARARGLTVRLLHVVTPVTEAQGVGGRVIAYADQEAVRVETEALAYLKRAAIFLGGVAVVEAVREGDVIAQILEEAEAAGVDLIAMATHRRHGLGRLLKGSVVARLQRETTIPLLLVPYGERAAA